MQHKYKSLEDIYIIIAQNIKKYRLVKGFTQRELAKKSGYSYSYIKKMEGYNNKNISIKTIYNISRILEIDIKYLFDDNNI